MTEAPTAPRPTNSSTAGQGRQLGLALLAFTITFWAWNLIAPLGVLYTNDLDLSANQKSLLVAIPVLVGSLGRIVTGALTDRFGGRSMFTVLCFASIFPVLLVAWAGEAGSYTALLASGFLLGIAGTTFAVGVPFVNAWYEPSRRGFATGVFGAGMGGTALSAFFTPRFVDWFGYVTTHVIMAVVLAVVAVVSYTLMRDAPGWSPNLEPVVPKLLAALRLPVTWGMSFLYAVCFGGFVAFSTYLPTYLKDIYDFDLTDAGTRAAGFAIAAVVARPIGGVLSDRITPKPVVITSLTGATILALVISTEPPLEVPAGATFVAMAFFLGLGAGGVFAWVARKSPPERVGSVTGIVGAAGGLGGFFPPLVMGATYDPGGSDYLIGLILLSITALIALLFTIFKLSSDRKPPT